MFSAAVVAGSGSRRRQALGRVRLCRVVVGVIRCRAGHCRLLHATVDPGLLAKARERGQDAPAFIAGGRAPGATVRPSGAGRWGLGRPIHSWPAHPSASSPPHGQHADVRFRPPAKPTQARGASRSTSSCRALGGATTLPGVARRRRARSSRRPGSARILETADAHFSMTPTGASGSRVALVGHRPDVERHQSPPGQEAM